MSRFQLPNLLRLFVWHVGFGFGIDPDSLESLRTFLSSAEVLRRLYGEAGHSITLSNPAVPDIILQYTRSSRLPTMWTCVSSFNAPR